MNWFFFSLIALLCWSGSDLFSKIGCRDSKDKFSQFKMITAVGVVMGLHACFEIFVNDVAITWEIMLAYLPISMLYIISMALGYVGLRYIELSVSSPICNASGALVAILSMIIFGIEGVSAWSFIAVGLVCAGVIGLGFVEYFEDDELRLERQSASNYKYSKSWLALCLPIAYCVLDAAGSFADSMILEDFESKGIEEASANVAYELTFLAMGAICLVITLVGLAKKKHSYSLKNEPQKYIGALFETAGQFAYIYALSDSEHVMFSAPIISSYCAVSVLWGRLFLKEKLSWKHYIAIFVAVAGIAIIGLLDP